METPNAIFDIDRVNRQLDQALFRLRTERRDVLAEYNTSIRTLDNAKFKLIAGADEPELFDLSVTLTDDINALIANPSLK